MKLIYKRVSIFVLIFLVLVGNRVECLFIIPSILMAMGSGLLMGKMTMGGLLMMLMAANQQQQGQSFLRSLGIVPHASSNGILVPTIHSNEVQDLIVRRKRDAKLNNDPQKTAGGLFINEQVQYRIMRQVANSDPLSCLPQTLCGISASPPSTQSGILNDYAYLLKTVFSRDEDLDDLDSDFEGLKTNKKNKTKTATSNKKKDKVQDDESSEEEEADDEEVEEQRRKDAFELEDLANEELLGTEPAYIPFALKNSYQHSKRGPPQRPIDLPPPMEPFEGMPPGGLEGMTESELDEMLARLGGPQSPPSRPNGGGSLLSNLMPKLSLGFTPGKGDKFDDDPFFSGFKRSSGRRVEYDVNVRPATAEEEELFKEMRQRRRQRKEYIAAKRQELAQIKDPVEKFRIAVEFGERIKSPRQCRLLFNNCPFNYTQVLGMVADMRKVLMGQPLNEPQRDTVVDLKPANTKPASVINLNAGVNSRGGVTSIIQELPTGEKVEINLKMTKTGLQQTRKTIKPNSTLPSSNNATRPKDQEQIFDDAIPQSNNASAIPLKDLESLKATVMALEKINALSVKKIQPISYSEVLSKLKKQTSPKVNLQYINTAKKVKGGVSDLVASPSKKSVITKLDDNTDNSDKEPKPVSRRKSNSPKKTASFLATLSKVEDDEADDNVAQSFSNIGTKLSTNMKLEQLLIKLKEQNSKKIIKPSNKSPEVSEEDDYEDEEDDEDEVGYKSNLHIMDEDQTALSSSRSIMVTQIPPHLNIRKQSPLIRHTIMRRRGLVRKPKKLFLGYDKELPRDLPS